MMGEGGASAVYSRPTSTTRQSHKSQLNSAVHKPKMSKQQVGLLWWGADTVIKFSEIQYTTAMRFCRTRAMKIISKRMQGDTI